MDDLTQDQLAKLRADLVALKARLEASLHDARTETVELSSAQGRVSRVDALQQQQMALAERRRNESRLDAVIAALGRLDDEDFGWCARCGEAIGFGRLEARPEGPLCVACVRRLGG